MSKQPPPEESLGSSLMYTVGHCIIDIPSILSEWQGLWPVSRKSRKPFGPEELFLKLRLAHCVKLVFSYVVKGRNIKITGKFRALRRLRFENTKRTMSPEMRLTSFGTFEKRGPGFPTCFAWLHVTKVVSITAVSRVVTQHSSSLSALTRESHSFPFVNQGVAFQNL